MMNKRMRVLAKRITCGLLGVVLLSANDSAQAQQFGTNILPNGNFESLDGAGRATGWKMPMRNAKIETENGNHFLVVNPVTGDELRWSSTILPIKPDAKRLRISGRLRVRNLKMGKEVWQTTRIAVVYKDKDDKVLGYAAAGSTADTDWKTVSEESDIPAGTTHIGLDIGNYGEAGEIAVDDVQIVVLTAADIDAARAAALAPADAPVPAEAKLWNSEPVEVVNSRRAEVVLNGVWKFRPATEQANETSLPGWGYIRVPGDWRGGSWNRPGIVARGKGPQWLDYKGEEVNRAWYERDILIPADWRGRAVVLDFSRVSTDAQVWINNVDCGKVEWPSGKVDITKAVTPGQTAKLRVLVVATAEEGDVAVLMATMTEQVSLRKASLASRGIIGDVVLQSRPQSTFISDVFVQTSTRKKQLGAQLEISNATQSGPVQVTARLLNEKGVEEKIFTGQAQVQAGALQTLNVSCPWENPRLWDFKQPNLYTLQISVKGAGVDDEYSQEFGFREFWIEGKNFFLNGKPIRLRPTMNEADIDAVPAMDALIDGQIASGFNFSELWPWDQDERGVYHWREQFASRADRKGFLLSGSVAQMAKYMVNFSNWSWLWDKPGQKEKWEQRMLIDLRRYRNHPSIVMWATTPNFFGGYQAQSPNQIGRSKAYQHTHFQRGATAGREGIATIKKYDPTRPVFTHMGTVVGDVYTNNIYLNFIPLQEREEWLSRYALEGDMPYLAVEFGTPLYTSFMRGRNAYEGVVHSEPLVSEYAAIYFGKAAYANESAAYREQMRKHFEGGLRYSNWHNPTVIHTSPNFQMVQELFNTNTWRSWRTMGVTGGMIPWGSTQFWERGPKADEQIPLGPFKPGQRGPYLPYMRKTDAYFARDREGANLVLPGARALIANNHETLAWIAGGADARDVAAFTSKDHSFAVGSKVNKQVALLNDTRTPQPFSYNWQVLVGGKSIAKGSNKGTLEIAQTRFFPISFSTPSTISIDKADGEIRLQSTIGARQQQDTFAFRVFAKPVAARGTLTVYDPAGETTTMLRALGYTVQPWQAGAKPSLLVIGRKAMEGKPLPLDLKAFVQNGGRALVMAQSPQWIEQYWDLRVAPHLTRRVFPVADNHAVLSGLDERDLRDWTGHSKLVEAKPEYKEGEFRAGVQSLPYAGWRWGNRGAVSSASIEKPHRSSWRPILESEFDLAYSPLMELDYGRGRLTLCTLDLEDHSVLDPAANRLARNLLTYVQTAALQPKAGTVIYLGGDAGARQLEFLGVNFRRAQTLDNTADLVIVGPDATVDNALNTYLQNGGKAVFLPRSSGTVMNATVAPAQNFLGATEVAGWSAARGLSVSDLRWRTEGSATVVQPAATLETTANGLLARRKIGKGEAVWMQVNPDALDADKQTYFRFTRWRHTRALSQVLANMGASFATDERIFTIKGRNQVSLAGDWMLKVTQKLPSSASSDKPTVDNGISAEAQELVKTEATATGWSTLQLPQPLPAFVDSDGEAVVRRVLDIPQQWAGQDLTLSLGAIDDFEDTYFNGERIGHTDKSTPEFWSLKRSYTVPGRLVKAGRNVLAVRVFDHYGGGGFYASKEDFHLAPKATSEVTFYHPDYRTDFELGDDPYRYFPW